MAEDWHSTHAVFGLKYHRIWCTKNRGKILRDRVAECARGCFCATVGAVDEAPFKTYIENQKWDKDDESFKITAPTKP